MTHEDVDMLAGDFTGASWRRKTGPDQQFDRTLGEALKNARLPVPPGPHHCGRRPRGIPSEWTRVWVCQAANSQSEWLTRKHGAFEINQQDLGLSPKDQTSHHKTWIHTSHVSTP